ncbi:transposase [Nonomuraea sp. NPDC052265]|uniref:transposase n=1 Tax=Nonomuraea sp. NPDC052265 TaxID=3364374 RepID=UPI0037C56712
MIKPKPLQSAVEGGFTVDDFTVDEHVLCRTCPLRARCTKSKTGRKIVPHEHDAVLRTTRRDWATNPALRERYMHTPPAHPRIRPTTAHPDHPPTSGRADR